MMTNFAKIFNEAFAEARKNQHGSTFCSPHRYGQLPRFTNHCTFICSSHKAHGPVSHNVSQFGMASLIIAPPSPSPPTVPLGPEASPSKSGQQQPAPSTHPPPLHPAESTQAERRPAAVEDGAPGGEEKEKAYHWIGSKAVGRERR